MGRNSSKNYFWLRLKATQKEVLKTLQRILSIGQDILEGVKHPTGILPRALPAIFFAFTTLFFFPELLLNGHIVHSDLDFGFQNEYLFRVFPLWNDEWSTTNFFNLPRIFFLAPLGLISKIFSFSPSLWEKSIIGLLLWISGTSFYFLLRHLFAQDTLSKKIKSPKIFLILASLFGGVFYAYNPFVVIRIQHLFLLVGYAFLPLVFLSLIILTENLPFRGIDEKKYNHKLFLAAFLGLPFLWALSTGAVHYLIFIFFLASTWGLYRILRYSFQGDFFSSFIIGKRLFLSGMITFLLLSFYFFSYYGASKIGSINPPNINSIDSIDHSSRNNLPLWILFLISYWWSLLDIQNLPSTFWIGGGFLLSTIFCGILFRIHNKFVLYSTLSAGVFYVLSFGTKWMPEVYLWLIFKSPFSGFFGFIFRDSNKFVGILSFFFSILLSYGIITILERLFQIYQDEQRWEASAKKKLYFSTIVISLFIAWGGGLYFYFTTVHELYFHHFYHPITIPKDYESTREFLKLKPSSSELKRNLLLPRCERLVSPGFQYCLNTWNAQQNEAKKRPPRAGSSQDITSLSVRTFHPLEGTTVFWGLLYDYIFNNLTENRSQNMGRLFGLLGIDNLVLHEDIVGFEKSIESAENSLSHQPSLQKIQTDLGFFKIFKPQSVSWAHLYSRKLLSFSGLMSLDAFLQIPQFQAQDTAFFFGSQSSEKNLFKDLNPEDLFETKSSLDLLMTQVDGKYKKWPFDFTLWGNPSAHWSKLRTDTSDWNWYLKSLGLQNGFGDFDASKGIAYTAASAEINQGPYDDFEAIGQLYKFPDLQKNETGLFISEVPEKLSLQEGFSRPYDPIPAVFAKQQVGPGEYWRVAKTHRFPTKPNNGYYFEINLSGRKAHKLHAKIKYFDAAGEEVGVAFTAAPSDGELMDFAKFKTINVSPPESETFQIEILSLEDPEIPSFWQLNSLKILDLASVTRPNILNIPYTADQTGEYEIFVRAFTSPKGGTLEFQRKNDQALYAKKLSTQNEISGFKWFSVGTWLLKSGENLDLEIRNLSGFNGLNTVAFVPKSILETIKGQTEHFMQDLKQIIVLESDLDFQKQGHLQNPKNQSKLTNGQAIELRKGRLQAQFEVVKSNQYIPSLRLKTFPTAQAENKKIHLQLTRLPSGSLVTEFNLPLEGVSDWEWKDFPLLLLEKGFYQISLELEDKNHSLIEAKDFRAWDHREFEFTLSEKEKDFIGCSPNVKTSKSDINLFLEEDGSLRGAFEKSVSCDWVSVVSEPVRVNEGNAYLLEYQLDAEHQHKLHTKLLFFDRDRKFIKSLAYGTSESESFSALQQSQVFTPPPESRYLQMQILSRPHPKSETFWKLKNLQIRPFSSFPGVDLFVLKPPLKPLAKTPEIKSITKTLDGYKLTIMPNTEAQIKPYVLQFGESFSPFWNLITSEGTQITPTPSFLVLNAFDVKAGDIPREFSYKFLLQKDFTKGLFISLVTFLTLSLIALHYFLPKKIYQKLNKFIIRKK